MTAEPLRVTEAARRLEMPTRELLRLMYDRHIDYVMVNGIAHLTAETVEERRRDAS